MIHKSTAALALLCSVSMLTTANAKGVMAEGDSITHPNTGHYIELYKDAHPGTTVVNNAYSGSAINFPAQPNYSVTSRWSAKTAFREQGNLMGADVVTVLIGANDLAGGAYANANAWLTDLYAYAALVKASGAKIAVGTLLPQCTSSGIVDPAQAATHNSWRSTVNTSLRAAVGDEIDAVIDFAANTTIGDDADACNATYYGDGLHPTGAGHAIMASIYTPVVDAVLATIDDTGRPSDVARYVPVAVTYAADPDDHTLGDGSNTYGGTPPAMVKQPADIPSTITTGFLITGGTSFCVFNGTTCTEGKSRFHANTSHVLNDDPIRNPRQPGRSHCHQFFGATSVNAYSTFKSLRDRANQATAAGRAASTAAGGSLNATGYWFPCPIKTNPFGDGKDYVVKLDLAVIYYAHSGAQAARKVRIPRRFRYVLGFNMDDPDNTGVAAEIAAANALPGNSGRYSVAAEYGVNGFKGWLCLQSDGTPIGDFKPALKNADGTDPWAGTCVAGGRVYAELYAPACWDGVNLWSPGGYNHLRHFVRDGRDGGLYCPKGWYELPQLVVKLDFSHQGFADYGNWRLSSDDMAGVTAGRTMRNGESMHTDWFGGWDDTVFAGWQAAIGIGGGTVHELNSSTVSTTQRLLLNSAAPDGSRNPQVNLSEAHSTATAGGMFRKPGTFTGTRDHHTH